MQKAIFNWSGGKDSALALYHALRSGDYEVKQLLTTVNATYKRISMHGVREALLDAQAVQIGIPLTKVMMPERCDMEQYNQQMAARLSAMRAQGIEISVFGDIFLEDLRQYREEQLQTVGLTAAFPIWKRDTSALMREFIHLGFKTIVTCVNEKNLDESFVGRVIDAQFLADLPSDVDPCGENGEFHTFVYAGPIFKQPIPFTVGETTYRRYKDDNNKELDTGFWYCDLIPA
jgi:uncharacterized protein (TIGR00290 family)